MNKRGSVLGQVLVLVIVGSLIVTAIIRARLQPAMIVAEARQSLEEDLAAHTAVNRVQEVWARLGSCSSDSAAGLSCSGAGCACSCETGGATVVATPRNGTCVLNVVPH